MSKVTPVDDIADDDKELEEKTKELLVRLARIMMDSGFNIY